MNVLRVAAAKLLVKLAELAIGGTRMLPIAEDDDAPLPRVVVGEKASAMVIAGHAVPVREPEPTTDAPLEGSLRARMSRRTA
jgi:hypothetical protein